MAVFGSLETFSLLEVLDFVGTKQGWLDVELPAGEARFGVRGGGVLHECECSWLSPHTPLDQVVFDVLMQRDGRFGFEVATVPNLPTMTCSTLLRAVDTLANEWEEHGRIASDADSQVALNWDPARSELVIDRPRWQLVRHLAGGSRTVAQLVVVLEASELEVRRWLSDAFTAGLVTVDGRQAALPLAERESSAFVAVSLETRPMPAARPRPTIDIALSAGGRL